MARVTSTDRSVPFITGKRYIPALPLEHPQPAADITKGGKASPPRHPTAGNPVARRRIMQPHARYTRPDLPSLLRRAMRHGGRADDLVRHVHDLIDLVAPPSDDCFGRAVYTERQLRAATANLSPDRTRTAIEILLRFDPATRDQPTHARQHAAAEHARIAVSTLVRHHTETYAYALAAELYRAHPGPCPEPTR
jgi:hypothetical protein